MVPKPHYLIRINLITQTLLKALFLTLTLFYCEKSRWPSSWQEIVDFDNVSETPSRFAKAMRSVVVASPRAIALNVNYTTLSGVERKPTFIAPPRCDTQESEDLVSIAGGGVTFALPKNFMLLSVGDVKSRWKLPPFPDAAWGDVEGRLVAIRFGEAEILPDQLPEFANDIKDAYEAAVPQLVWISREHRGENKHFFLYHAFESESSRGRIFNIVLTASFDRRVFSITVSGPATQSESIVSGASVIEGSLKIQ